MKMIDLKYSIPMLLKVIGFFIFLTSYHNTAALADNIQLTARELHISGLTFSCLNCRRQGTEYIEVPIRGERMLVTTDKVIELMLEEALRSGYDGARPSAIELHKFLFNNQVSENVTRLVLHLLMQTTTGSQIIISHHQAFIARYADIIQGLLFRGIGNPRLWDFFWKMPGESIWQIQIRMRAAIAHYDTTKGLPQFIETLSITNSEEDLQSLIMFREAILGLEPRWARALLDLINTLDACRQTLRELNFSPACVSESLASLPDYMQDYLERVRVNIALQVFNEQNLMPEQMLSLVTSLNYEQFRTPRLHRAVVEVLKRVIGSDDEDTQIGIMHNHGKLLRFFADHDDEIRIQLAILLAEQARILAKKNALGKAIRILRDSISLYPSALNDRREVIEELQSMPLVRESEELMLQINQLLQQTEYVKPKQSYLNLLIFIATVLIVLIFAVIILKRDTIIRHHPEVKTNRLSSEEREELRNLLKKFGLTGNATEAELAQAFRALAKVLHPDASGEPSTEFVAITESYNKARALMRLR